MLIIEVPAGSRVVFELSINGQKYEFSTKAFARDKGNLLTDPIKISGKNLSFNTDVNMTINFVYIRKDKSPVVWKGVGVTSIHNENGTFYSVKATSEGFEMNRRGAFRLFVGVNGVCQMGINKKAVEVIVKDVSETGFSFVSKENHQLASGMPVRLVFNDMGQNYGLMGKMVRKVEIDEFKFLYGCELNGPNSNLVKYINEKQRQMLAINSGNSVAKQKEMLENSLREPSPAEKNVDEEYDPSRKSTIKNDGKHPSRKINTVGKTERRDIFKDKAPVGKKK